MDLYESNWVLFFPNCKFKGEDELNVFTSFEYRTLVLPGYCKLVSFVCSKYLLVKSSVPVVYCSKLLVISPPSSILAFSFAFIFKSCKPFVYWEVYSWVSWVTPIFNCVFKSCVTSVVYCAFKSCVTPVVYCVFNKSCVASVVYCAFNKSCVASVVYCVFKSIFSPVKYCEVKSVVSLVVYWFVVSIFWPYWDVMLVVSPTDVNWFIASVTSPEYWIFESNPVLVITSVVIWLFSKFFNILSVLSTPCIYCKLVVSNPVVYSFCVSWYTLLSTVPLTIFAFPSTNSEDKLYSFAFTLLSWLYEVWLTVFNCDKYWFPLSSAGVIVGSVSL